MAPSNARKAKEPAIAVRLALLLDGRRTGLTAEEIRRSGVLTLDDRDERRETLDKRFERARDDLGRVGIVVSSFTPPGQTEERYVVNAGLSYSAEQRIHLSAEQALSLGYLLTSCQQANLPFRDDLESARRRLLGMLADGNAGEGDSPAADQPAGTSAHPAHPTQQRGSTRRAPRETPPAQRKQKAAPAHHDEPALGVVSDAYTQFHPLTFSYVNAQGGASRRTVEVYGTFAHRTHTYFVGRDTATDQVRVFRVERVQARPAPTIDTRTSYTIPADFDVRDYRHLPFQYGRPGSTPFVATFRDTRGLSDQQRAALTQGHGTWEHAGYAEASEGAEGAAEAVGAPDASRTEDATGAGSVPSSQKTPQPGDIWRVEAADLEETACWAALALASDGLVPLDPPELVAAVRDGLERTVALHG